MQIVLKRIAKKKTYTIGRLYILKDEDVKKRTVESVNKCRGLKTVCEVPREKLNADSYFCDTLEPCWRNLLGVELSPAEENVRLGRVSGKKAQKMKGTTAIPEALIRWWSVSRRGLRCGCRCCWVSLILRASASMPAIIPMIRRAASWWVRTE